MKVFNNFNILFLNTSNKTIYKKIVNKIIYDFIIMR